ncbi:agglutinin biogenesis protein MshP [Duganella sp. FT135W]|uniref:Agglutinin biogenesis protein MshP n=1 Tax=Duganella flavida TaxID=2692175 RepID=A0A6L8KFE8_9BURK|nr:agglutinin biogenesis protein MshP [Duganella flavida]MYM26126.1 agglutinin biogenesis protein MshP [Duganella flavida]
MKTLRKQAGVALVTAIFLLVVIAGLAVAVVSLTSAQQDAATKDEMGTRAYLAAKAGMEWALFTALQGADGAHYSTLNCAAPISFSLPAGTTLSGFTVTISCTPKAAAFGDGSASDKTADRFGITSTACNAANCSAANPGPDFVKRVVTAQL